MYELPTSWTDDDRAKQILTAINRQNDTISESDRKAKYQKMAESAFVFYRGSNHLFWDDFAGDRRLGFFGDADTRTWLQGDLHIENFGAFGNDRMEVVYNVNDFDEAVIADYQYDLWRMAVSIVLVARQNGYLTGSELEKVVQAFAASYLEKIRPDSGLDPKNDYVFDSSNALGMLMKFLKEQNEDRKKRWKKMLKKWTVDDDNKRCFDFDLSDDDGNKLLKEVNDPAAKEALENALNKAVHESQIFQAGRLRGYNPHYFQIKDMARRLLAGTGSLGTPRYYVLIEAKSEDLKDDRILDIKLQTKPTAYQYLPVETQPEYVKFTEDPEKGDAARWHEAAHRALAVRTDDHLGWLKLDDDFYSIRERSPSKKAFPVGDLKNVEQYDLMARQWGAILAYDHAKAVSSYNDEYGWAQVKVSDYLSKRVEDLTKDSQRTFQALLCDVAFSYADQVETDYQNFAEAYYRI